MKNNTLFILLLAILCSVSVFAQNSVSGNISDENGDPLIGVSVFDESNNSNGTITDTDGNFSLSGLADGASVMVSYIGYASQSVEITGAPLNLTMGLDAMGLDEVVVTGTVNPKSKLKSSVSISTLRPNDIAGSTPRTTAEIFRMIPGVRSESSGGEGNTNIAVRGVPISAGGSKYLQLQEDGLPIFMFGDIAFATS